MPPQRHDTKGTETVHHPALPCGPKDQPASISPRRYDRDFLFSFRNSPVCWSPPLFPKELLVLACFPQPNKKVASCPTRGGQSTQPTNGKARYQNATGKRAQPTVERRPDCSDECFDDKPDPEFEFHLRWMLGDGILTRVQGEEGPGCLCPTATISASREAANTKGTTGKGTTEEGTTGGGTTGGGTTGVSPQVLKTRLKQLSYGKATAGYQNYRAAVPLHLRSEEEPHTPNPYQHCSKRQFTAQLTQWRKDLHRYDGGAWKVATRSRDAANRNTSRLWAYLGQRPVLSN